MYSATDGQCALMHSIVQVRINPELELKSNVPPRWWNAAIPVVLIVVLVFVGLIATGVDAVRQLASLHSASCAFDVV